jgi:chorismate-pyruvate lyase
LPPPTVTASDSSAPQQPDQPAPRDIEQLLDLYYRRAADARPDRFKSKGFDPEWRFDPEDGDGLAMARLPPFLRTLLVTDGTVTKSLEAYYWEPVTVACRANRQVAAREAVDWLEVPAGEALIARSVLLQGVRSGRTFASALSVIRVALIPEPLRESLLAGQLGIGELIRECGLETYRELREIGRSRDMGRYGGPCEPRECVFRSYRIIIGHRPAMLVTECFPIDVFAAPHPQPG